jgi:sterol desaturase/sphingolipid hydroxylase (fatty acid hydroxylase superfamily)
MDDLAHGVRNKRGDWSPKEPLDVAPFWRWPISLKAVLGWLPGYFLPYNVVWMLSAVLWWAYVLPDVETMKTLQWGWIAALFAVNCLSVLALYGFLEFRLYGQRAQGTRFKYNAKFPDDAQNDAFLFKSQRLDSLIRSFGTGLPIWTAWQVLALWAYANGWGPWTGLLDSPIYLALFALLVPAIHETHFFLIHRLIHTPFLYKWVHSVHHNSVNPSPWSSLSMHPVEHALYFSTAIYHLILPSHPLLMLYQVNYAGLGAVVGHIGFDKIEVTDEKGIDSHAYCHYLHHKHFEVNYGDGLIPFDKWFGTWHDGSKDGEARMNARYQKRKAKLNQRAST